MKEIGVSSSMNVVFVIATLLLVGCASTSTPIDIPVEVVTGGDVGEVNTSINNSVQNIVSQLEVWQMSLIVGLAWLVGWLSPGPLEIIRGFFGGVSEVIKGLVGIWRGFK